MSNPRSGDRTSGSTATGGASDPGALVPFLLGTAVGGVAGAVVGTLLSEHAAQLFASLLDVADRRGISREKRSPKFEFLLQ